MKLSWREIKTAEYQDFIDNFDGEQTFVQSVNYGRFRESIGEKIYYVGIFSIHRLIGVALIQKVTSRIKTFLHCPHGPLVYFPPVKGGLRGVLGKKESSTQTPDSVVSTTQFYEFFLKQFRAFGRTKNCDFVRINPLLSDKPEHQEIFRSVSFRPSSIHMVNPEHTWILDVDRPADEILADMKKKRRAEARSAKKFGAETIMGNQKEDLDIFWDLHRETVARQGFVPFPRSNTEKELQIFGDDAQILSTKIDDKYYTSALILFDKKSAYYHQGSSIRHPKNVPVARINLWESIQAAQRRGCKEFNFWGIVEDDDTKHPWYGLSQFKKGFGGSEKKYLHCQDSIIKAPKYWMNYCVETYRRWKKGY